MPVARDRAHDDAVIVAEWLLLSDRLYPEVIDPIRKLGRDLSDVGKSDPAPDEYVTRMQNYLVTFQAYAETTSAHMGVLQGSFVTDPARLCAADMATSMADMSDRARRALAVLDGTQDPPMDRIHLCNQIFKPSEVLLPMLARMGLQHAAATDAARRVARPAAGR